VRLRIDMVSLLAALGVLSAAQSTAVAAASFNVTNNGFSAFSIDGVDNPSLTLTRGQTYTFNVSASGHPFWIATARGAGDAEANAFSQGVTGNGASPGMLTFVVPMSAPPTLFYQCAFHDPMGGTLTIVGAPAVPAVGPATLAALAGLLLFIAIVVLRRRGQNAMAAMRSHDQ
jgi:hypothetical protein